MEQKLEPKVLQKLLVEGVVTTGYAQDCVMEAFNEGRQSVIDNIPDLVWEGCVGGFVSENPFYEWYIEVNELCKEKYTLVIKNETPKSFARLNEAKQAANEDYKKRIKKALGL